MACGPDGRVYLVFTRRVSNNSDVLLRVFDGTKWSKDRPVAATPADEYDGSVVVGKEGELWLAWTSNARGKKYNIFVARADRPSAPIQPTPLTQADDDAMHARLACDRDGRVWATYYKWHKRRGCSRDREVYVRRNDGKNWSREIQVSPQDVPWYEDHSDPAIAPYADGVVVCWSWDYHRPKGYPDYAQDPTIFARTIGDDLNLGNPVVVSRRYIDTAPAVAVDPVGRVWCAWDSMWRSRSARGNRRGVFATSFAPGKSGKLSDARAIAGVQANTCTPRVIVSPRGTVSLIWSQRPSAKSRWTLQRAAWNDSEKRWSRPSPIETRGNPRFPCVAHDSEGSLWVAYSQQSAQGLRVTARKVEAHVR